jgi:hypothetical protein
VITGERVRLRLLRPEDVPALTAILAEPSVARWWAPHGASAAAREPKRLVWYEANHGLNDQATADFHAWLVAPLGSS